MEFYASDVKIAQHLVINAINLLSRAEVERIAASSLCENASKIPAFLPMSDKKTERLSLVIDSDLKKDFEKLCKVERRSMSAQVVVLIEKAVNEAKEQGKINDQND
jgi:hypothetical protein